MALSIGAIVWNVSDLDRAREFWSKALDYAPQANNPDFLAPKRRTGPRLHLDEADRTHLDLWVDGSDAQSEVDRLISLGATRVDWDYPEGADFVVLADTEGNLFCVIE